MESKQDAGREGVQYQIGCDWLRLYYKPMTQAAIGQKQADGQMVVQMHPIGPPDGCMARIYLRSFDPIEFSLDRECVPVLDRGGPWVRETRDLEALNEYLSLFGLKMKEPHKDDDDLVVELVDCKEPQDYCEHETNWYAMQIADVEFTGGLGLTLTAEVPCDICGKRRTIEFTIPEEVGEWPDEEDDDEG